MLELFQSLNPAHLADYPSTLLWLAAGGVALLLLYVIFFMEGEQTEVADNIPSDDEPLVRSRVARKKRR